MLLNLALGHRVLFLGGKGGVGKTTVASAVALAAAQRGRRVLVVSTDPAHNLGHLWGRRIGDRMVELARPTADGGMLHGIEIDPGAAADQHVREVGRTLKGMMPAQRHSEVDRHMDLSRRSPGTHEAAVLERMTDLVEQGLSDADLVVFDTAPSGHTARLMALPELMTAWTDGMLRSRRRSERLGAARRGLQGGEPDPQEARDQEIRALLMRRRDRLAHLREVLTDGSTTSFGIVLAAERLPVLETIDLHEELTGLGIDVGALVVNRRSPADRGEFLARRRALEEQHLLTLRDALPRAPLQEIPLIDGDVVGADAVSAFAEHLTARSPVPEPPRR